MTGAAKKRVDETGAKASWLRKPAVWMVGATVGPAIAMGMAAGVSAFQGWRSDGKTIGAVVIPSTPPPRSVPSEPRMMGPFVAPIDFVMVVPDPNLLPADLDEIMDCDRLYTIGKRAGGRPVATEGGNWETRIVVQGAAKPEARILGIRAKVTRHAPVVNGIYLSCQEAPAAGAAPEQLRLTFDFKHADLEATDTVPAAYLDLVGKEAEQFTDQGSVALAENQSLEFDTTVYRSIEDVDWHLEADVLAGGKVSTKVIKNHGKDFHTPGYRDYDRYTGGHIVYHDRDGFSADDWGADRSARLTDHGQVLSWKGIRFPYRPGLTVYQPFREGYRREIRLDGRTLLRFNLPSEELDRPGEDMKDGELCDESDWKGPVMTRVDPPHTRRWRRGRADYTYTTIGFSCKIDKNSTVGPFRRAFLQRAGSSVLFQTALAVIAPDADRRAAEEVLRGVRDGT